MLSETEKAEVNVVKEAMLEADRRARERRKEAEFNEKHGIKTPEDSKRFIQKCKDEILIKTSKWQYSKPGKEAVSAVPKKKCLNCGSVKILRQRDETLTTLVWVGYDCLTCGERRMIL